MSVIIVGYARTPFVRYSGVFAGIPATALGAHAATAALKRAGIAGGDVDRVIVGQVLQGAAGQNPARQTAAGSGVPLTVPAVTVNVVCLSGLEAVQQAVRLIEAKEAQIVLAVGQESMTSAPHATHATRLGRRYGAIELIDTMEHDGLTDAFEHVSMGASTEAGNAERGIRREEQDAWSAASHQRAAAAVDVLAAEISPYEIAGRSGSVTVSSDDGVRSETTAEVLARLRPAFAGDGTITAGNSAQLTDGAAAIVLMDEAVAAERGVTGIARVVAHATVAGPDVKLHTQPANAIRAALQKTDLAVGDLETIEINEAFAAVSVYSANMLAVDPAIVNPHGGAIALGHPIGASGTRIVGHAAASMHAAGPGKYGAAAICGGGGQGAAIILQSI